MRRALTVLLYALIAAVALFSAAAAIDFAGAVRLALRLSPDDPLTRIVGDRVVLLDAGRALTGTLFCVLAPRRPRTALALFVLLTLATTAQELLLRAFDAQSALRAVLHLGGLVLLWAVARRGRPG